MQLCPLLTSGFSITVKGLSPMMNAPYFRLAAAVDSSKITLPPVSSLSSLLPYFMAAVLLTG